MITASSLRVATSATSKDRRRSVVGLVLLGTFLLPGCSFLFVDRAPPRQDWNSSSGWTECTHSRLLPAVDTGIAIGNGLALMLLTTLKGTDTSTKVGAALDLALYGASAVYGFVNTGRCRDFQRYQHGTASLLRVPGSQESTRLFARHGRSMQ